MKGTVLDDRALVMDDDDTVATALADLSAGDRLADRPVGDRQDDRPVGDRQDDRPVGDRQDDRPAVTLAEDVPFGHKVALVAHESGDPVRKYGEIVGEASTAIEAGEWVHTHNCHSRRGRGDRAGSKPGSDPGPESASGEVNES